MARGIEESRWATSSSNQGARSVVNSLYDDKHRLMIHLDLILAAQKISTIVTTKNLHLLRNSPMSPTSSSNQFHSSSPKRDYLRQFRAYLAQQVGLLPLQIRRMVPSSNQSQLPSLERFYLRQYLAHQAQRGRLLSQDMRRTALSKQILSSRPKTNRRRQSGAHRTYWGRLLPPQMRRMLTNNHQLLHRPRTLPRSRCLHSHLRR